MTRYPYHDTALASFLRSRLERKQPPDDQPPAGLEGLGSAGLRMMAQGEFRVPIDKVPALARLLGVNAGFLWGLGASDQWPDLVHLIADVVAPGEPTSSMARHAEPAKTEDTPEQQPIAQPADQEILDAVIAAANLDSETREALQNLNFKVTYGFYRRFCLEATLRDITNKELLIQCFEHFIRSQPAA